MLHTYAIIPQSSYSSKQGLKMVMKYDPVNKQNAGNWTSLQSATVFESWMVRTSQRCWSDEFSIWMS